MSTEKSFTLLQLQQSIKRKMQEVGQQGFWITAEIAEVKYTTHCYIELVQKDVTQSNEIVAKARAVIWANQLLLIKQNLGGDWQQLLKQGAKILTKVFINYHEVFGLSLVITDIDLSYTLGELELQKQATINYLQENSLLDKQKNIILPIVIQRIAILSSAEAAGYEDFINQLEENRQGYQFDIQLFKVAVQGEKSIKDITNTLADLAQNKKKISQFDVVVLIRGGGSRLDLEAFNSLEMAVSITNFPLPIFTGIGHQKDQSVADLVSFHAFKTPTAVAEFILQYNEQYEKICINSYRNIVKIASSLLRGEQYKIKNLQANLPKQVQYLTTSEKQQLKQKYRLILHQAKTLVQNQTKDLEILHKKFILSHPANILAKGYSITLINGKPISTTTTIQQGDTVHTTTQFITFESKI
ncbi:MAG: exodeoxyribonuclease VII large subunit [Thermoflexibacteraceae bacterium]|jgi:exodeoxyribonuclease VII large subunit